MAEDKKDIILSIRGMSKSFGRNKVLKHIDLDVKKGSIMGLMGENGAGKSTMMKCLFGRFRLRPDPPCRRRNFGKRSDLFPC
mgnify:CR=1 FL=1